MSGTFTCEGGCGRTCRNFHGRKTRMCKICCAIVTGKSAEKRAKNSVAMKKRHADPAYQAKHSRRVAEGVRALLERSPAEVERRRAAGIVLSRTGLGHAAQSKGSAPRMQAGRTIAEQKLGWCPAYLRDEYRALTKGGLKAAEARAIIEDRFARDRARRSAKMSFEDQLRLVRTGQATIAPKFRPTRDTGPFTLGGVGSGML